MIGLYVHVPFCRKKCHYCNFVVTTQSGVAPRAAFLEALGKESARYHDRFQNTLFDTLYVGGGTPSTLSLEDTRSFFNLIHRYFGFRPDAEVTFEVNPGDVDAPRAALYRECGVNRISMGVQSFSEKTLRRLNRSHGAGEIYESFEILKKAGFQNISVDLMLSLPEETLVDVRDSLNRVVDLAPQHVSLYELVIENKTVFENLFQKGRLGLPKEAEQVEMLSFARSFLGRKGFRHYELLSYAQEGFESRHNRIYWANQPTLGLGPGAFSYLDGRRFRHSRTVDGYLSKIKAGDWSPDEEEQLEPEAKAVESFLLALRLSEGADRGTFGKVIEKRRETLLSLQNQGLLEEASQKIRLTPRGQFFAETVFAELSLP